MAGTSPAMTTGIAASLALRRPHQPDDQPDRDDDDRAEQEVAPDPPDRVETHVPDADYEPLDARNDVPRVESEHGQDDADQDRQQDQPHQHHERRAAEKAGHDIVGHRFPRFAYESG